MTDNDRLLRTTTFLLSIIALIAVVAALRAAQAIVVPFMLAVFAALMASPALLWLRRKGIPSWLAVVAIVLVMVGAAGLIGFIAGTSVQDFSDKLPGYTEQLRWRLEAASERLGDRGAELVQDMFNVFDPGQAMNLAVGFLNGVGSALTNAALIVFILIFILLEVSDLPAKMRLAVPRSQEVLDYISEVAHSVKRYVAIKTVVSLATGLTVGIFVAIMRIDFAVLWGLLAFLLNYVPNIGSILAAIPAVLLAVIQHGSAEAIIVAAGYLAINTIFGNIVEPRLAGRSVGLSSLVVFLSLVFWGWVLGAVGMLLSVPLTATIKIALEASESTRWAAVLLGSAPKEELSSSE